VSGYADTSADADARKLIPLLQKKRAAVGINKPWEVTCMKITVTVEVDPSELMELGGFTENLIGELQDSLEKAKEADCNKVHKWDSL